jgi:hypothetical protein
MLLDLPKMSFAVWLVSDFVSTPFALNSNLKFHLFPYLRLDGEDDDEVQDENMFSFTARTLRWFLSAESTCSYFHRLDPRMCLLF